MKKLLVCALTSMSLLFASIANAEFILGVQGGYAQAGIDADVVEDAGLTCDSSACDGGSGSGFGLYVQFLTKTASGGAAGIHIGSTSYSLDTEIKSSGDKINLEYDANVFDVLGVYRSRNNIFLMAGFSKYETDSFEVTEAGDVSKFDGDDDTGFKLVAGLDIGQGSIVVSPAISYADYGNASNTELRIGVGYRF